MKKLTVMAACAALLLGGGCFLKANQNGNFVMDKLIETISASTEGEGDGPNGYYSDRSGKPKDCTIYQCCNARGQVIIENGSEAECRAKASANVGWSYYSVKGLKDKCPKDGDGCWVYTCSLKNLK